MTCVYPSCSEPSDLRVALEEMPAGNMQKLASVPGIQQSSSDQPVAILPLAL